MSEPRNHTGPERALLPYVLYALFLAFLLFTSWLRWPDAWVDFGFFLYHAWVTSTGAVPGTDFHYFYGPLAIHAYGGLFALFGARLALVYAVNLLLLCADVVLLHRFFRSFSRTVAVMSVLCFLGVFAVGQYVVNGNYNFLAPYKPEIAIGTPLLLAQALLSLRGRRALPAIGLLSGALLLTSSELLLASLAAAAVLLFSLRVSAREALGFAGGLTAPPLLCLFALSFRVPFPDAFAATFRAVEVLFHSSLTLDPRLQEAMGVDAPLKRLADSLVSFGVLALLTVLYVTLRKNFRGRAVRVLLTCALPALVFSRPMRAAIWLGLPKCLPFLALAGLALWARDRGNRLTLGIWSAVSLLLLARIIGNVTFHHYGFSLAFPACLLLFPFLMQLVPGELARRGIPGDGAQTLGWALLATLLALGLTMRAPYFEAKTVSVSHGGETLYDYPSRGPGEQELLDDLARRAKPSDLVLGLPDGHVVSYLLRLHRPEPFSLSLGELRYYGEPAILESYRRAKPRFVFVSHDGDFGERHKSIMDWVHSEYRAVRTFGQPPWIELYEAK